MSNLHVEKMGKLLEKFRDRCTRVYRPGRELAYDEQVAKTDYKMTRRFGNYSNTRSTTEFNFTVCVNPKQVIW